MPRTTSRPRRHALAAALVAALGCSEVSSPSYVRLDAAAPRLDGVGAGATLVVFWASWCPPCRAELPSLRALASDPPAQLAIVTFGEDDEETPVRELLGGAPPPELGWRPDVGRRAATALGVDVLPAAFLVADGRLVARFSGQLDWSSRGMRRLLARLASEGSRRGQGRSRPDIDVRSDDR